MTSLFPGGRIEASSGPGTIAALVTTGADGAAPFLLSAAHVLAVPGEPLFSPDQATGSPVGMVIKRTANRQIDAAFASATGVSFDPRVTDLGVTLQSVARPQSGARVVKPGRVIGIVADDVGRSVKIRLASGAAVSRRGFLIKPDPLYPPTGPLTVPGDSGGPWLFCNGAGTALPILAGIHIGKPSEVEGFPADWVFACLADQAMTELGVSLWQPDAPAPAPAPSIPMLVATREAAILRGLPSQSANRLDGLAPGRLVHVLGIRDGWAQVSLKGDNLIDGFVWADLLRPPG